MLSNGSILLVILEYPAPWLVSYLKSMGDWKGLHLNSWKRKHSANSTLNIFCYNQEDKKLKKKILDKKNKPFSNITTAVQKRSR